jgi:CMP-N-acetylneuraminic acid synthetase
MGEAMTEQVFSESYVLRLQAKLAAVTQERDALKEKYERMDDYAVHNLQQRSKQQDTITQLQATNKKLRDAFERYGFHDANCGFSVKCSCGFTACRAALTLTEEEPKP